MEGLTVFRELFDTNPPEPLEKTATDGTIHVNALESHKTDDPKILAMWTATDPKFSAFMADKTIFDKGEGDLKIMNAAFDVLEKGLNAIFSGYHQTITGFYPIGTDNYKKLFFESVSDMFNVGIATKMGNVSRFLLALDGDVSLAAIKTDLLIKQGEINTKQVDKNLLKSQVDKMEKNVRASQKIFCQEEQGNVGGLMQLYKATPFVCNSFFNVTDIKRYKPTEVAIAKKEAHLHTFLPNTITVVEGITLSPSCDLHVKNISVETVKIGTTYSPTIKPAQKNSLDAGKTFKKKIVHIGDPSNTLLVIDTTGCTQMVTLEITVKNVTVKNN